MKIQILQHLKLPAVSKSASLPTLQTRRPRAARLQSPLRRRVALTKA
jgi:hypothetical protein